MPYFYYSVTGKEIQVYKGELATVLDKFHHYSDKSFGESDIYYKVDSGKISEIICDTSLDETYARKEVIEFLENLSLS